MPIPISAAQASLIIDGVVYVLRDVSAHTADTIELDRMTSYDGGRTLGRTRGVVSSRVVIEAEVMPEPTRNAIDECHHGIEADRCAACDSDGDLRSRIARTGRTDAEMRDVAFAVDGQLDALTAKYGVKRWKPTATPKPPPAPEPKSVWDRLLDERELC